MGRGRRQVYRTAITLIKEFSRWAIPANSCLAATSRKMTLPSRHHENDEPQLKLLKLSQNESVVGVLAATLAS